MAVFNPIVITTAGISLLSQAMAGKGTLTFTSVATSTTVIPYNISNIQAMTALSGIVQTVVPVSAVLKTGNVQVSSIFSNSGVTNAYTVNTIGLYAALGNGAQTLFAVAIATTPDNIPVQNDLSPSNFYYQFNIAISDTSQLTVTVPEDGSLPASVFNQMFPGIAAPGQNNDGDALVYNASSGAWGYVNTETVFTTVSGSGEFVSLQKTLADDFKQIQLFGKSVQKPTTGAQLFDIKSYVEEVSDAEIVDYKSGEFTLDTSNIQINTTALINLCPKMVAGNSYLLTGVTTSNNKYLYVGSKRWNFGEVFIPDENDLSEQCFFTCTTVTSESGEIEYYKDTFKHIMIVEGSSKKSYEVYTGGEAATKPTPEFPLPITSAGNYDAEEEKYEIGILVANKNFASNVNVYSGYYSDGEGSIMPSDSRFIRVSKIKIIPGVKYRISSNLEFYSIWSYDVNDNPILRRGYSSSNTVSLNATDKEVYIGISLCNTSGQADTTAFEFIQVEVGEEQTSYIDGKSQNTTLQIPNPLRGIPVNSEGNYTDAKGQKFLGDIADKQKSKIYRGCGSKTFNGSETWYADTSNHIYTYIISDAKIYPSNALCDSYVFKRDAAQLRQSDFGFAIVSPYYIQFKNINVQSLDDWKSMLQTRPITIVYPLTTPTEESLTPDQLAALNLSTYQGITNIGTDTMPQAGMSIESRGFNLASDLAQDVLDLQNTVQIQGTTVSNLNSFINRPGRIANGVPIVNESNTCLMYKAIADIVYPVGSIYLSVNNINPGTLFGGTWVAWGSGQVPVGVNTSITQFATVEQTGGEITHTLTTAEMPSHDHSISGGACTTGSGGSHNHTYGVTVHPAVGFTLGPNGYSTVTGDNQNTSSNGNHSHSVPDHAHDIGNTGGGQAHNNLQPYITCYMWKRTA